MADAQSSDAMHARHYGACSRCQSLLEDITHFLTEEARCSVAQASTKELLQRADTLILCMADAIHKLGLEIPEEERDLWVGDQIQKYIAAIEDLREFIWSKE